MPRVYVFTDESGNLDFSRKPGATLHFTIGSATMSDCSVGDRLLELRRELAWRGLNLAEFHATSDKKWVRDQVFEVIRPAVIRVDATILEKPKTKDHLRNDHLQFYKEAVFLHFKWVIPRVVSAEDELVVVASSLQIKRKRQAIYEAVHDVVRQVTPTLHYGVAFWPSASDPCLQVADYMTWAVHRKHENGRQDAYDLIKDKLVTEFRPFDVGPTVYY